MKPLRICLLCALLCLLVTAGVLAQDATAEAGGAWHVKTARL